MVGTPYANRSMPELKQLAGCMVNTLAMRTTVSGEASFGQLLKAASRAAREAYAHAEAPFAMVVDALKQPRSASFTPVYQVDRACQHLPALLVARKTRAHLLACASEGATSTRVHPGAADLGGRLRFWP